VREYARGYRGGEKRERKWKAEKGREGVER
jgi:hypothetical protein